MTDTDEAKGRSKQAAGVLTGDKDLEREGKVDRAAGKAKDAGRQGSRQGQGRAPEVASSGGSAVTRARTALPHRGPARSRKPGS